MKWLVLCPNNNKVTVNFDKRKVNRKCFGLIAQSARNIFYIRKSILGVRLFDCMKQVNFSGFKFWTLLFHTEITGTQMLL